MRFTKKTIEEQETIMQFDYYLKIVNIYTTRVATMKKLNKILGQADNIDKRDGKIDSMEWNLTFGKRGFIKKCLSLLVLLPFTK